MPDIRIQHAAHVGLRGDRKAYSYEELSDFFEWLCQKCAELFSVEELPLTPDDFSLYDELLLGMSKQTHGVIVRITLHNFVERVQRGDNAANELAAEVAGYLNTEKMVKWRGRVTVGVSLVFAEIAWGTA
jgi:hypothetical protein